METYKLKKIFTNVRVILILVLLVAAFFIINPSFESKGLAIRSVAVNSSAAQAGIIGPSSNTLPRQREVLLSINNIPMDTVADYYDYVNTIPANMSVLVETNKGTYRLLSKPIINTTVIGYEDVVVEKLNASNETYNVTETVPVYEGTVLGTEDLGLSLYEAPTSNLRLGLDLEGGTRVLLQPEERVDEDGLGVLIDNLKQRLNVYGLSDIIVKSASDLSGETFILVEIPGANKEEVRELLSKQGKFEAKIGQESVFLGGEDITHVCRTAECSGIDRNTGCGLLADGTTYSCRFQFAITLSNEAAQRQALLTKDLDVVVDQDSREYLSQNLTLYLDNSLVDELRISAGLKGEASTDIAISGSGIGLSRDEAVSESLKNMKRLQTILITGSLPVKLNIVKTDNISPVLGEEFIKNVMFIGLFAIIAVFLVVLIKYRKIKVVLPMLFTMFSELILLLGFGALAGWSIDLAAIAGIIIAIGTGIDHQIVISDEILRGEALSGNFSWSQKIKRAFSIIIVAYLTTVAAMFFLLTAGAGLLKGFALTTIMGVTIGVLITRPAFASIIEILLRE